MKNLIKIIVILFITTISNAQVANGQYALNISSATATSNTIDVTLTVSVLAPSPGMRVFGFQTSINFNTAIINGGTISAAYVGGRSPELAAMTFGTVNSATAGTIRIPLSSFSGGATSVDMALGTTLTLGTYRISNTANWANENANLWLQDIAASGKTRSAVNGYPFGLTTPQYAYSTTTPVSPAGLVLSHLASSPYSVPLGTLGASNFDYQEFMCYPNPVADILNVKNSKIISEITITNLLGQTIMIKKPNITFTKLDLSGLSKNIYFVKIVSEGKSKIVKIIKN
jgi:hypothetical protein